jgi:hypothetical protein
MTLGVGQMFSRNETWAEQAKPWIDYLSRSSFMLQAGKAANDLAVFYGEESSMTAIYGSTYPDIPEGYRYDYVSADALLNNLSVKNGEITTRTGMHYKAMYFGKGTKKVTLPVLEKALEMVQQGAVIMGARPQGSPSLSDDPGRVKTILDMLWPGAEVATVGKGRVYNTAKVEKSVMDAIHLAPDFMYKKTKDDSHVMFIHRSLIKGEIYFVANRTDHSDTIETSFRVTGFKPELWDPATGTIQQVSYRVDGERTLVTIPFDRFGSVFIVFREKTKTKSMTLPNRSRKTVSALEGPWLVSFQKERGAPDTATFKHLEDFRDNPEPGIRYFSGIASYKKEIVLSDNLLGQEGQIWLDLGEVYNLAEVWVNGNLAGTAWKPPYRVDISSLVKSGKNVIEIKSVNLWVNRLIGDAQPGVKNPITLTTRNFYQADSPLVPSGLVGPVKLVYVSDN